MKTNSLIYIYFIMIIVIIVLPFYSYENYSIISSTTSQLGAQQTTNAWIMNVTFILLGLSTLFETLRKVKNNWISRSLLIIFSIGLIASAFFSHMPIEENITYNTLEDSIHSFFATLVCFMFTLTAFSALLTNMNRKQKTISIIVGIGATILSGLMFLFEDYMGIFQRLIFISSFLWLVSFLENKNNHLVFFRRIRLEDKDRDNSME